MNIKKELALHLYVGGVSVRKISEQIDSPYNTVLYWLKKSGVYHNNVHGLLKEIKRLRAEGYTSAHDIADIMGVPIKRITESARQGGIPFDVNQTRREQYDNQVKQEQDVGIFINERQPHLKYHHGYSGCDSKLFVECKECGCVFEVSMITIRHNRRKVKCPDCKEKQKAEQNKLKQINLRNKRIDRETVHVNKASITETFVDVCEECGRPFFRGVKQRKYCSDKCMHKHLNRTKANRRRKRLEIVDNDISLEKLAQRDNNICHICGMLVDWNDCITLEDGTFMAGENYPSIDHVWPVARGGKHSWENVRLAHRHCNSIKSDNVFTA